MALTANAGTTNIAKDQTLASLDIGDGATVVIGAPFAAPALEFFGNDDGGFGESAAQAVPEPGSASLFIMGVLALAGIRRRIY